MDPDGLVGERMREAMNVPVETRIDPIVFNIDLHCSRSWLLMPGMGLIREFVKVASPPFLTLSSNEMVPGKTITKIQASKNFLKERNGWLPDLGYQAGLYIYTHGKTLTGELQEVYGMQAYDRDRFGTAIDGLPEKGDGPTMLPSVVNISTSWPFWGITCKRTRMPLSLLQAIRTVSVARNTTWRCPNDGPPVSNPTW